MVAVGVAVAGAIGAMIGIGLEDDAKNVPKMTSVPSLETGGRRGGVLSNMQHPQMGQCDEDKQAGLALVPPAETDPLIAEKNLELASTDPKAAVAKSHTDAGANIALYQLASSCAFASSRDAGPPSREQPAFLCPSLGLQGIVRIHPIELLQRAAELGSTEAKVMYAQAAPEVAAQFTAMAGASQKAYGSDLLLLAERFGVEAARSGHPEAMRYMSVSYETGRFGGRDLQRAYRYALRLQASGDADDRRRMAELERRLSTKERLAAQLAQSAPSGCDASPGFLNNPFN